MSLKSNTKFRAIASAKCEMNTGCAANIPFDGVWYLQHIRGGEVIYEEYGTHNLTTDEGRNLVLNALFNAATLSGVAYVGLKGTGAAAEDDTMASHAGWSEVTDYADDRKEYVASASSGASPSLNNTGNEASFAINGDATVAGAFICFDATGTDTPLFCAVDFASSRTVANGDTLNVGYTLSSSDS